MATAPATTSVTATPMETDVRATPFLSAATWTEPRPTRPSVLAARPSAMLALGLFVTAYKTNAASTQLASSQTTRLQTRKNACAAPQRALERPSCATERQGFVWKATAAQRTSFAPCPIALAGNDGEDK